MGPEDCERNATASAVTTRATSEASILPTLYDSSSGRQPVDHEDERDHQEHVDDVPHVECDEPEQPKNDENDDDDPK
jgi:hypothetical protein